MRTAFIQQLIQEARHNPQIFLLVGDLGFSVVEPFAEEFPDRFLNVGIAEQNMTGIAAGLAMEGYRVFTYSIANFPTLRALEQIRYDICYHNLDVKIVAVGAGYAYASLGPSHHATEDIGILRTLPNLSVVSPADPHEARSLTTWLCETPGPAYLRLGKAGEPEVHPGPVGLQAGFPVRLKEGREKAVLTTGSLLKYASEKVAGTEAALYSFPFLKPLSAGAMLEILEGYPEIFTLEEHQLHGGFGSVVAEMATDAFAAGHLSRFPRIHRIGINDRFLTMAGSQEYIRSRAGIILPDLL